MLILTINSGSSSVKFQVYDWEQADVLAVGVIERIGQHGTRLKYKAHMQRVTEYVTCASAREAVDIICRQICAPEVGVVSSLEEIGAVGHRVSHGGEHFTRSCLVDDEVVRRLKEIQRMAPLHLPANIAGIETARERMPGIPHAIVVDTAWHQTMGPAAFMYAVPRSWYTEHHVRRYGFHGTSFLYCAKRAAALLHRESRELNAIICHVGNGSSVCAVREGISYDTSMGLTPQEGLIMGTRCGDIDPSVIPYMMRQTGWSAEKVDIALNRESGLQGICGHMDRRDIMEEASKGDDLSRLAIDMESYRLKKYIGAYMAALGRVDALVFTAAAGEMSALLRSRCLGGLENFGIIVDPEKNRICRSRNAEFDISAPESRVRILVIPTDEEMVITEDTWALVQGRYNGQPAYRYTFEDRGYINKGRLRAFALDLEKEPALSSILADPETFWSTMS